MFLSQLSTNPTGYILQIIVVMFSICIHEYSHAYIALREGDSTAAERGHLTLNPMIQMGTFSIVMLLIIGISWGAVPVNPQRMRNKYSQALISFAGPASNILLFIISCFLYAVFSNFQLHTYTQMFFIGAVLNIFLFIFNMLPIPMLDGWTVFNYIFPVLNKVSGEVKNGLTFIIFILLFMTPLIDWFFGMGSIISISVIKLFEVVV